MKNNKIFKDFEIKVLKILIGEKLELNEIIKNAELVSFEYTGVGYFLTVRHPILPDKRIVCSEPVIVGNYEKIRCGFVVFSEKNELTLECHSWGDSEISKNFRDKNVEFKYQKNYQQIISKSL